VFLDDGRRIFNRVAIGATFPDAPCEAIFRSGVSTLPARVA
jgi:hypothetical protein